MALIISGTIDSFIDNTKEFFNILKDGPIGMSKTLVDNTKTVCNNAQGLCDNIFDVSTKAMNGDGSGFKNYLFNSGTVIVNYGSSSATR